MATYGKKLLDGEGNIILPKTRSSLVYMDDNSTVEDTIKKILNGTTVVGKATKLATARKIGNASFDGSGNITLAQIGAATTAQGTKADNAMPKSGGTFTGKVVMQWSGNGADTSGLQVMNNLCQTSAGANVSSRGFIFRRK